MKKYKVVGSSDPTFMNIEMNIVFDDISIGKGCEVFNHQFTITQTGKCVILSSETWVLTLLEIEEKAESKWGHLLTNPEDLRINHEIDIYIKDKIIQLTKTDRLTDNGVTYRCVYEFLKNEWKYVSQMVDVSFPFEYQDDPKLFTLRNEWNFGGESQLLLRQGSHSRYNSEGKCI